MVLVLTDEKIRILFVSDTHLGFDLPFRPRIKRRRRGPDFFKNFKIALDAVYEKGISAVVHGGDLLYRSRVPLRLVQMAFEPLISVADKGIPVYLVPGNHERSNIPYRILSTHPNIHIFNRPRTFVYEKNGLNVALAGFPFIRHNIRQEFPRILAQTGWDKTMANAYILCIHQCVEGASLLVGSNVYTFRHKSDVIRMADIPEKFLAVLSGHIHRFQVLTRSLVGNSLSVPVFFSGSTERTSFVEKDEEKGYITLEFRVDKPPNANGELLNWTFNSLPARPMREILLQSSEIHSGKIIEQIRRTLKYMPKDSIVRIKVKSNTSIEDKHLFPANIIRTLAPPEMNLSIHIIK